jgi:glycosyltransferase involved in cell wall biosynthesis
MFSREALMRIVIDLQGIQTVSRFRGIGRYTLALTQAVLRHRGAHEIFIVLNGLFQETIQPIRDTFKDLLPEANICIWEAPAPGPVRECDSSDTWRRTVGEKLREAYLSSLKPDLIWISSLFEGYTDNAITGIKLNGKIPVIVTLYDLIPLLNPTVFFQDKRFEQYYLRQISQLKQADKCLAISAASAQEACLALNTREDWISTLPSGYDLRFRPVAILPQEKERLYSQLGITKSFIMYVGTDDDRKNLPRLIQAYAQLPESIRRAHQLLMVGKLSLDGNGDFILKKSTKKYGVSNDELLLIDYIDDDALVKLYNLCEVFVLPSWHEGFGLPLVEAMACGAAAIGSNISSIPDVLGYSDALFDPFDVSSISQKLEEVLRNKNFRTQLREHGLKQVKKFSWDESARISMKLFEQVTGNHKIQKLKKNQLIRRKLALVSPISPNFNNINDPVVKLLRMLAQYYDIQLVLIQGSGKTDGLETGYDIRTLEWLRQNSSEIERVIYHVANSRLYAYLPTLIEEIPGIIVLDDFFLGDLFYHAETGFWIETLYHSHGYIAVREHYTTDNTLTVKTKYPVNLKIIQLAIGVITSCEFIQQLGRDWYGEKFIQDWTVIPQERSFIQNSELYADAIEHFYSFSDANPVILAKSLIQEKCLPDTIKDRETMTIAEAISQNLPLYHTHRQFLVDISIILRQDYKTGIQRVVRGLLRELLQSSLPGYRIEPVYLSDEGGRWHYKYARKYTLALLDCQTDTLQDDVVEVKNGDLFFGLDLCVQMLIDSAAEGLHLKWSLIGVKIYFLVYDLLPVLMPQVFPQGAYENFFQWLKIITQFDGAICISQTVASDLKTWLEKNAVERIENYYIAWAHLGADLENSSPSKGLPKESGNILEIISQRPSFLMVSTIEPRKGYLQTLEAFSLLWNQSIDINLIIVGKEGWDILPDVLRGDIPEITRRLRNHPERGKRLFWFNGISDEYLEKIYTASSCLIAASLAEGFGLPLIEAARYGLPIIARDIPIFREIVGEHAYYFHGSEAETLANAIKAWLLLYEIKEYPTTHAMPWLTWKQSIENILNALPL